MAWVFEADAVIVETARPDNFYARLTELAASGEAGPIDEVQSPDDNLQAVFNLARLQTGIIGEAVFKL